MNRVEGGELLVPKPPTAPWLWVHFFSFMPNHEGGRLVKCAVEKVPVASADMKVYS